jgi:hypothetical protein
MQISIREYVFQNFIYYGSNILALGTFRNHLASRRNQSLSYTYASVRKYSGMSMYHVAIANAPVTIIGTF